MSTTPASSASPVHSEWPLPPGATYEVNILGGRPLDNNDTLNGTSLAKYLADLATYAIHNVLPNTTWPREQWGHIYHMIVPHTQVIDLYRESVKKTLIEEGVPAKKIESAVAKIFTPFSILYQSFIATKNKESYWSDYFYQGGQDDAHRLMELDTTLRNSMEFDTTLRDCKILSWTGIACIIGGLALHKLYKPQDSKMKNVATCVKYCAIGCGLIALVFSTLTLPQCKN